MLAGDIKTIRELDRLLGQHYKLVKNSSSNKDHTKVFTKTYLLNPHGKLRIFFDEREKTGTIKFTDGASYSILCGASTFTLIQVGMLIANNLPGV